MTDRELTGYAAIAFYKDAPRIPVDGVLDWVRDCKGNFSPLTDDGDALKLAVKLNINIEFTYCLDDAPIVRVSSWDYSIAAIDFPNFPDPDKATRKAITYVAAEIGRAATQP